MTRTVSEMLRRGQEAQYYFSDKLGYDTAVFHSIRIGQDGFITYHINLDDDFQAELPHDQRYLVSYSEEVTDEDFYGILERWPNREQRELYVLAAAVAPLSTMAKELRTARVLAFVARLQPDLDELRRQLTDQRQASSEASDDNV